MPTPQPRWTFRFVNQAGVELAWNPLEAEGEGLTVFGRSGDFGAQPYTVLRESSADGRYAAVADVRGEPGRITIPFGVEAPAGMTLWDYSDQIASILRPVVWTSTERKPNSGYLYFSRSKQIALPDQWRIPVMPEKWEGWQEAMRDGRDRYQTQVSFQTLLDCWEEEPGTALNLKSSVDPTWSTFSPSITPGGDAAVDPLWTFGGPLTGTLNSITIQHSTTLRKITLNNLGLVAGQLLVINTSFLLKTVTVNSVNVSNKLTQDSDYFTLNPDAQTVTITKDGSSQSSVILNFRKRRQGL